MNENTEIIKLTGKHIEIIDNEEDKKILYKIASMLDDFTVPYSEVQIGKLILNDNEYPTEYSKAQQCKIEIATRFSNIVQMHYDIKKKELEIQLKDDEINKLSKNNMFIFKNKSNKIQCEMLNLDKEQLILQIHSIKARLKAILREIRLYYKYYNINNGKILSEEEREKEEIEFWKQKAFRNPIVFEDRYGDYLREVLGNKYNNYLELRKKTVGLLPFEMIE